MVTRGKSTLLAYLAGIVDADGHIAIHIARSLPKAQRRLTTRYSPEIVVTNTDLPLMDLLVETFGGRVYTRKKVKEHHKTTYTWKTANQQALAVALALEPFLFIKKAQAQIIIEYFEKRVYKRVGPNGPLIPEEVARREDLYQRLRALVDDRRPQRLSERTPATSG